MGIGENGHIAFNDPPVANFNEPQAVKPVVLDEICRNQQVNDGCFETIDDVPTAAITLTVPTLFAGEHLFCIVPAKTKARAVRATLCDEINEKCPATILRRHMSAVLYLDGDSSSLFIEDGVCKLMDRSAFAGSIVTADRLVRVAVKEAGFLFWMPSK